MVVGVIIGLAIYNQVICNFPFPMVIFAKLLGVEVGFEYLGSAFPELKQGLQKLLDYEGDARDLMLYFEVSETCLGETRNVELKPNGSSIPVTNENKHEFVSLYTDWVLNLKISRDFKALRNGFLKVIGRGSVYKRAQALNLFTPNDLKRLICGSPILNLDDLKSHVRYVGFKTTDQSNTATRRQHHPPPPHDQHHQHRHQHSRSSGNGNSSICGVGGVGDRKTSSREADPATQQHATTNPRHDHHLNTTTLATTNSVAASSSSSSSSLSSSSSSSSSTAAAAAAGQGIPKADDVPVVVGMFWAIFDQLSDAMKKKVLVFVTGTDRLPLGGVKELNMVIQSGGSNTANLPSAHTCFNTLILPEYDSQDQLKEKLLKTLEYSEGFGLN